MKKAPDYDLFVRERITELRQAKNVSEHKMSLDMGKSGSYIRSISSGKAMPSMREFFKICEYLEITPEEFFVGSSEESLRTDITKELQNFSESDLQKISIFMEWMSGREPATV